MARKHSPVKQADITSFLKLILIPSKNKSAWQSNKSTSQKRWVPLSPPMTWTSFLLHQCWNSMDTETFSTVSQDSLFLPQTISCWMHSLQFTYKKKKQCWPHMGPFFVWKRNNLFLKFSIKIHICIIIHFKAIREEWERSKKAAASLLPLSSWMEMKRAC